MPPEKRDDSSSTGDVVEGQKHMGLGGTIQWVKDNTNRAARTHPLTGHLYGDPNRKD